MTLSKNPYHADYMHGSCHDAWDQGYAAGLADGEKRLARALRRWLNQPTPSQSSGEVLLWLTTRAKRRKPIVIEAFQYAMFDTEWPIWFHDRVIEMQIICYPSHCDIKTLEGWMKCNRGDWVIQGVKGEIYPCKPDIFEATYEPVKEEALDETLPA